MIQLGMSLSEGDIHAMMRSVGVGPHGKISYPGIGCIYSTLTHTRLTALCPGLPR